MKTISTLGQRVMRYAIIVIAMFAAEKAVAQNCTASFTFTNGSNGQVTFTNTSTGAMAPMYFWNFGDNGTSYLTNPTHTYSTNGMYYVCVTMYDSLSNCQDMFCDTVNITNAAGGGCAASFSASINGSTAGFTNTSTGTTASTIYMWNFGDSNTSNQQNPSHTYANPGTYWVCLTIIDQQNNCFDSTCQSITIQQSGGCQAYFTFTSNGNTFNFTNGSTGGNFGTFYTWSFGDAGTSNQTSPSHTYANSGMYIVCLTMTDSMCTDTYCDTIVISGIRDHASLASGLSASPNPTADNISLSYSLQSSAIVIIEWMSIDGRIIRTENRGAEAAGEHRVQSSVTDLAAGTYLLRLRAGNDSAVQRVTVLH